MIAASWLNLVIGCESTDESRVAVEVWSGAAGDYELHHENGIYGMDRFARISKYVHFPWASGLPGRAGIQRRSC